MSKTKPVEQFAWVMFDYTRNDEFGLCITFPILDPDEENQD